MEKIDYPPLPDKRFFTIGEAATLAQTKTHILRYWEKHFPQLATVSRRQNGRRYFTADNVLLLRRINDLIKENGYTIDGVRAVLNDNADKKADDKKNKANKRLSLRREIEQIMAIL